MNNGMDNGMEVIVEPAGGHDSSTVARLMELYLYDFSELGGPAISANGQYGYPYLEAYWHEAGRYPFLIRVDGRLAGFALAVERGLLVPGEVGREMTEFFVLRFYRRQGVGREAARQVFARFPGPWWIGELETNAPAITFWRSIIANLTEQKYEEWHLIRDGREAIEQHFMHP